MVLRGVACRGTSCGSVALSVLCLLSAVSFLAADSSADKPANTSSQKTADKTGPKQPAVATLPSPANGSRAAESSKSSQQPLAVTQHTATIRGKKIVYTATAGTLPLKTEDGEKKADVFFVAYTQSDGKDPAGRPIAFCFNGGPGSASVWLHLGMLGPKRVRIPDNATSPSPPYRLIGNEYSLLDRVDLVFIDPVSTGYSRAKKGESLKQFHGYDEDIRSVGQFIHLYVTRNRRWASPKFLIGESYGTTRAAGLADHLQSRYKMYLNGIVMVSSVIDFQTLRFGRTNDLPYVLFLPSYTATAWYHKRLPADLQNRPLPKVLREVERFALGEYAAALMRGASLPGKERKQIARRLARYTGLSRGFVERANLRIGMSRFAKELLRKKRRTVGRLDSRFLGIDRDAAGENYEYDPSGTALDGPFGALINDYLRRELRYESDLPYELLSSRVHPWSYKRFTNRYVSVADSLRSAMTKNPHLRVFVANGWYDLATPYFASVYSYNHLGLDRSLKNHVTMGFYRAGHMMYIHQPSLKQLRADLDRFFNAALKRGIATVKKEKR